MTQRFISKVYSIYRSYIEQKDYKTARNIYESYLANVPMSILNCAIYDYICDSIAE